MAKKRPSLRDDSFLLIPASVIHDPRIGSLAEAAVFSLILGFSRKGELMRGGRAFVSEWTLLSGKWAGRILLSLEKKDLVRKVLDGEAGRGQMDLDLEDVIPFFLQLKSLLEEKKVL
jgi:hypothetical protein